MKFKLFMTLTVLLFSVGAVYSDDGLALMKIEHGALQSGMASAVVSIDGDPNNAAYNPALTTGIKDFSVSFGHTSYWENIRLESAYLAKRLSTKAVFYGGIRFAVVDDLKFTGDIPSFDSLYFEAHDLSYKSGLSYDISDDLTFGFAFGWFVEKIDAWRGSAFNLDFGMHYKATEKIDIGASATNLGSDFEITRPGMVGSNEISLPKTYRFGGSYNYRDYLGAIDFVYINEKARLHLGLAGQVHQMLAVRCGYMFNYDSKNFTAGFSFTKRNMAIDYAFLPFSNDLGTSHMFNLSFSM